MRTSRHLRGGATGAPAPSVRQDGTVLTRGTPSRKPITSWISSAALVGRDTVLNAMCESGRICTVVFGEAGIGKTRLLAEASRRRRHDVFSVTCVAAATPIPYDPFIALMRELQRAGRLPKSTLTAALGSPEKDRLFCLHDVLAGAAATGSLIIQVDDLHLADERSLQALQYCVTRLRDLPVVWHLASRRTNPEVVQLASSLERAELAQVISLGGLSAADLKTLATRLRPETAFDDAQIARLRERTGGNPLYAELLLIGAPDETTLPADLRQVLRQRLLVLSPEATHVASWLAVHAGGMSQTQLAMLAKRSLAQVGAALSELTDEWIISAHRDGFSFRHDLVREACYDMLDEESRAAHHAVLAERAESVWQRATHLDGARRFSEAAKLFVTIGWECLDRHAPQEALNAFNGALDRTELDTPISIEAQGGRAAALFRLEAVADANAAMASFEKHAGQLPHDVRVRVRTYFVEAVWDESDDRESTLPIIRDTIAEARVSAPDYLPRLLHVLGSIRERQGNLQLARTTLEEGIELCDGQRHKRERVRLCSWLGVVLARLGNVDKGIAVLEAAAGHATEWGLSNELVQCCTKLCYVSHIAGDNERYERWCRVGLDATGPKSRAAEALLRSNLASVAVDQGKIREALGLALAAEATSLKNNAPLRCRLLCLQAQLYAMLGDFQSAQRVLDDGMLLELPATARQAVAFTAGFVSELREDYEQALNWYGAAVSSLAIEDINEVYEVRALSGIVRLAALRGEFEKARAALEKLRQVSDNGWPVAERSLREAEGCFLLVQGDASGADELLDAVNDGEYPFWKAHLQLVAANARADRYLFLNAIETFDALGAEYAADRARALARSHGLRPGRKREARGALSARETSVAFLVANGKTNAEIGELLHISGRTVEYHIGNILSKCGLRSRVEIAAQIAAGRPLGNAV